MQKTSMLKVLLSALLTLNLAAGANASGLTRTVHFTKGSISGQYWGTIRGYNYDRYFFHARAGQKVTVNVSNQKLSSDLTGNGLSAMLDITGNTLNLPRTGNYELRILQPRAFARRGEVQPYKLTLTIR